MYSFNISRLSAGGPGDLFLGLTIADNGTCISEDASRYVLINDTPAAFTLQQLKVLAFLEMVT